MKKEKTIGDLAREHPDTTYKDLDWTSMFNFIKEKNK